MNAQTDQQLLRAYVGTHSEAAFSELVHRHIDLVYSAALRMVCDSHQAEDITQSVFVALAQNARQLTHHPVLSGWLHRTTQNLAANAVRTNVRRQTREQEAVAMNELLSATPDANWEHIAPHLDAALGELSEPDRDALLLRYFERKSAREMAKTLGISDEAAQKRVSRAVERLREFFAKRGVTAGASGLVVLISANAVQAAPVGLAVTISTAALAGTAVTSSTVIAATTKTIAMTTLQKTFATATVAVLAGAGIYETIQKSGLDQKLRNSEQQQASLLQSIDALGSALADATNMVAALRAENDRLNGNSTELLKLRSEVGRLRNAAQQSDVSMSDTASDITKATAITWVERVAKLKQRLKDVPETSIPELSLMDDEDWLAAVQGLTLESDTDYRVALSKLRQSAERKAGAQLQKALQQFVRANNNQPPAELSQLQPYFDPPIDGAILSRWRIADKSAVPNVQVGQTIITQRSPVDEVFDQRLVFSADGGNGATDFLTQAVGTTMQPVFNAYRAAHDGQWQTKFSDLLPYATTPEQEAALQKLILRAEVRQPKGQ